MAPMTLQLAATRAVAVRTRHSAGPRHRLRVQAAKSEPPRKLGELRPTITPRPGREPPAPAKPAPKSPAPKSPAPKAEKPAKTPAPKAEKTPAPKAEPEKTVEKTDAPTTVEKDIVYIGKGKFVKDDVNKYPDKENVLGLTGLTGGWAGGEKGLLDIKAEYKGPVKKEKVKEEPKVIYNAKTGKEISVSLTKDFGGAAGGWPGGEKGIYKFVETGEVVEEPEAATLGWGPGVLLLLLVGAYGYNVYTSAPEVVEVDPSNPVAVVAKKESAPPPPAQSLALTVAPYGAGAVVVGAGAVVAVKSLKGAASKAADTISKSGRVVLLAAAAGAIAAKIVGVL